MATGDHVCGKATSSTKAYLTNDSS
ncbi:hypothetical protein PENDEC_c011G07173 [Penicillium decumbens]|uniref:Uncharacterized protein n=1 Tax=Penicillium decumbens TaxID=69771 RepID=A0A1V6PB90_PENDC|nr:hypothetical protein PENDEC_c011G07173 [Penicillium decumbens]